MKIRMIDDKPENHALFRQLVDELNKIEPGWEDGFAGETATAWQNAEKLIEALDDRESVILLDINMLDRNGTGRQLMKLLEDRGVAINTHLQRYVDLLRRGPEQELACIILAAAQQMGRDKVVMASQHALNTEFRDELRITAITYPSFEDRGFDRMITRVAIRIWESISEWHRGLHRADVEWKRFREEQINLFYGKNIEYHEIDAWLNPATSGKAPAGPSEIIRLANRLCNIISGQDGTFEYYEAIKTLKAVTASGQHLPIDLAIQILNLTKAATPCVTSSRSNWAYAEALVCKGHPAWAACAMYTLLTSKPDSGVFRFKRVEPFHISCAVEFKDAQAAEAAEVALAISPRDYAERRGRDRGGKANYACACLREEMDDQSCTGLPVKKFEAATGAWAVYLKFEFKPWAKEVAYVGNGREHFA